MVVFVSFRWKLNTSGKVEQGRVSEILNVIVLNQSCVV